MFNHNKDGISKKKYSKNTIRALVCMLIIGVGLSAYIVRMAQNMQYREYAQSMITAVNAGRQEYNNSIAKNDIYARSNEKVAANLAGYAGYVFANGGGYLHDTVKEVMSDLGYYTHIYYFKGTLDSANETVSGSFYNDVRKGSIYDFTGIDDRGLYELLTTGQYNVNAYGLSSAPVKDGEYVILVWEASDILTQQAVLEAYATNYEETILRINAETGYIEDSSDAYYLGLSVSADELGELKKLVPGKMKLIPTDEGYEYVVRDEEADGVIFYSYITSTSTVLRIGRNIMLPIILSWMFLIMIFVYAQRFTKEDTSVETEVNVQYQKLIGKRCVNRELMSHISGMSLFAIMLIAISSIYMRTLVNFSSQNVAATNNLKQLEAFIDLNEGNNLLMQEDFLGMQKILIDSIAQHYVRHPEQLDDANIRELCNRLPNVSEIAVYDKTGTSEYDTTSLYTPGGASNVGYTLSHDELSAEYPCWEVLEGKKDIVSYNIGDNDHYYAVGRRQDKPGLISICVESELLSEFEELTDLNKIINEANFSGASKAYMYDFNTRLIYWIDPLAAEARELLVDLPEEVLLNGYAGTQRINGTKYYLNVRVCENDPYILMSAKYVWELNGLRDLSILAGVVVAFIAQYIILILGCSRRLSVVPTVTYSTRMGMPLRLNIEEQMMNEKFRKAVANMLLLTCVMVVLLLCVDAFNESNSLVSYLFRNQWSKGLNLFSMTMILFVMAAAIVGGRLIQVILEFFTKNMGPRGVTIGRMVGSLVKFALLLIVGMVILIDLGVNLGTLLAGAGIAGALISFCAQQTVNDFLSGFFIVFEGLFNIGDWITVNDFRGQVIEIGIRTTKIAKGNNVQIINNSELKTVTLMDVNGTGAVCLVDIAYKEDADKVIALIRENVPMYAEKIPFMLEGPFVDGVVELNTSGVTIRMWALADQAKVNAVERDIYRLTKELFDKNHIEIPFNQVTIHTAD